MEQSNNIFSLRKRLLAVCCAVTFIFCLLFGRLAYLQINSYSYLQNYALDQWTRDLPIRANRGEIYDRNGVILATNQTSYDIYLRPRMVENDEYTAQILSQVLGKDKAILLQRISKKSTSEFTVALSVPESVMKSVMSYELKGVYYSLSSKRYYPYSELLSQVLGYTTLDGSGLAGIEKYYDDILRGENGKVLTEADLLGMEIKDGKTFILNGVDGLDIELTIDYNVQAIAENALEIADLSYSPTRASAIVMDANSGEILAIASTPTVDLNNLPRDDLEKLSFNTRVSAISDVYEPGSTFKILTSAINVEEYLKGNKNSYSLDHVYYSAPTRVVDGQTIKCWDKHKNGKHSSQDLKKALQNSCNPVFVDIALKLGKDCMYDYFEKFGLGKTLGIDFLGEAQGMLINKFDVKNCDLARIGFGQTIAMTGLQLISSVCSVVNGGILYKPTLLKSVLSEDKVLYDFSPVVLSRPISKETSNIMREYLLSVVEEGSGIHAKVEGYLIGGKTGTAQKYENGTISNKYLSSFIGFYPADTPKYVCLVMVDEPQGAYYGSTVAAPVARQIFEGIINLEN